VKGLQDCWKIVCETIIAVHVHEATVHGGTKCLLMSMTHNN